MNQPIIMHINCCEQGQSIEDACRKCAELGFDGIEFRRKRSVPEEDVKDYLDSVSREVENTRLNMFYLVLPACKS